MTNTNASKTLYSAFYACGCLHMCILSSDARSDAYAASWRQQGYDVRKLIISEIGETRCMTDHTDEETAQMHAAQNAERRMIYMEVKA